MTAIDSLALTALIRQYGAVLVLYARQWCSDPDDAVQEAFIDLSKQTSPPSDPGAWLFTTTKRRAINQVRGESRRRKRNRIAADQSENRSTMSANAAWFESELESREEIEKLQTELEKLERLDIKDPVKATEKLVALANRFLDSQMENEIRPKLKALALAVHNHESAFTCLPPAAKFRDSNGKSGLSWRVHILPFLDGGRELYQLVKLDEPWDSPHNKPLLAKMPTAYRTQPGQLVPPADALPDGYTTLVAPVGKGTIFGGTEVVTFGKILDGSSNTIMFVEVKPELAVPWTAPDDYAFDLNNPVSGLTRWAIPGGTRR